MALILDGHKRADAARAAGMDRQTLYDWVHRYNADGHNVGYLGIIRLGRLAQHGRGLRFSKHAYRALEGDKKSLIPKLVVVDSRLARRGADLIR